MVSSSQRSRLRAEAGPVMPTVDPADIRGLATTLLVSVGRLPLSRFEGRPGPPLNVIEGYAKPGPHLCSESGVHFNRLYLDGHLLGYSPHEGDKFPGDSSDSDIAVLTAANESAEALAEPDLRFPSNVLNDLGESFIAFLDMRRDLGRVSVCPGPLNECAPSPRVSGLGNRSLAAGRAGGVLGGDQPDKRGELAWVVEACDVAEFSDNGESDDGLNTAQCLQRLDDRVQAPRGGELGDLVFETLQPFDLLINGTNELLEGDLLGGCRADDLGQVATMSIGPVRTAGVVEPQAEQERLQSLLGCLEGDASGVAGTAEVTDRFVLDGGDVYRSEISGAQQASEFDGITSVGLDLVPRALRDQGRRNDLAVQSLLRQVAIKDVAAGSGFVCKGQAAGFALQPANELVDIALSGTDLADELRWFRGIGFGVGDADGVLVDIETDEKRGNLGHG